MENSEETEWIVENFYFGNAVSPSDATWRHRGTTYQVRLEVSYREETTARNWASRLAERHPIQVFDSSFVFDKDHNEWWALVWYQPDEDVAMAQYMADKQDAWT